MTNAANPKPSGRPSPKGRRTTEQALEDISNILGTDGAGLSLSRENMIEYLHALQDSVGHISASHIAALAKEMGLAQIEVFETATFYAHFDVLADDDAPPPPLTVRVCEGISCQLAGGLALIDALRGALGTGVRIQTVPCVGACDKAPVAVVGKNRITDAKAEKIVAAAVQDRTDISLPDYQGFDLYRESGGYSRFTALRDGVISRDAALMAIEESGLRGLGGAGFPVAAKWRFLKDTPKPRSVAVNADEGEPGTFKDHQILTSEPHRMLEGALIAAHVVDAEDVYIYLRDEYPDAHKILSDEIDKLESSGLTLGLRIHLRRGAGSYVCGEETALLESLEGKRGLPRNRPPYPAQSGLFGRPTLINNVETLYWVTGILQKGSAWYAKAGHPHFYSVSGRVADPGVKLAPTGTTLQQLVDDHCGGMADGHTLKAYLPGGASGGILPATLADVPLSFGTLEEYGCFIGSSAVVVLSDQDDMRAVVRNLVSFFAHESCGQCTPCRVGCDKLLALTDADIWDEGLINELAETMRDGSICGLGQAAPNPVTSVLRFFAEDLL